MNRSLFLILSICALFVISTQAQQVITLQKAITMALQKNYDVQLAQQNAKAGATDNAYAVGAFLPQINGVASAVWNQNQQDFRFEDETRNVSGDAESNNYAASAQLVWTLFDGTRMFATRQRVRQIAVQGDLQLKEQMSNTIAEVINTYSNISRQKQQLRAIQEQMGVNEERVKLAEKKLQVGSGAKPELLQAKVDLNAQKTAILQQEALIEQLQQQFNVLLGMQLSEPYQVEDSITVNTTIQREDILGTIKTTNFSLQVAEQSLRVAQLSLQERQAERLPFINFNASYNFTNNNNTKLINPFSAVQSETKGYNYGLSLTIPILNGLNTSRQIQQARISVNRQNLLLEQQRNNTQIAVRNTFTVYENALKILQIEEDNIVMAKENVTIALEGFKRGLSTYIELRTAQQSLEQAYNRLITARYNAKVSETELLRLSGELLKSGY